MASAKMFSKLDRVLSLFALDRSELAVHDIAKQLDWPISTTYRLLSAMRDIGFLDFDETARLYRIGIRMARYGELAQSATPLQRAAKPHLQWLSEKTGETAALAVLEDNVGITLEVVESRHHLAYAPGLLGHFPLHCTASGKAFLAFLSPEERSALLVTPLKRYTSTTVTDRNRILRDVETARRLGYAVVDGEHVEGVFAVAAPVFDGNGKLVGAVGSAGPRSRVAPLIEPFAAAVVRAANAVSRVLGHSVLGAARRPRRPVRSTRR
jgi:DNA-binding IclR family transcriptional regulator